MARALMLIVLSFFIFPTTAQLTDRAPLATKAQQGNGKLGMELVFDDSNLFRIRPFRPSFRPTPHNQLHCCTDDIFGAITCRCLR